MKTPIRMVLLALTLAFSSAHAAPPSYVTENKGFMKWYSDLTNDIVSNKQYKRIPLDTDRKADEFVVKLYELYTRQIDDVEFMTWVNIKYPGHEYEQIVILDNLDMHKH